jgi:acyl-coenzyme A synthetase/AMP-(fatty) acid ligase
LLLGQLLPASRDDAEALVTSRGEALRYAELRRAVETAAAVLQATGVGPGRVVAVRVKDPAGALVAMLAALAAGGCVLPLDTRAGEAGVQAVIDRARPAAVVMSCMLDGQLAFDAPPNPRTLDEDAALLLFTSGSSGEPKGVVLGAGAVSANVDAILAYLPVAAHARTAILLPMSYSYALVGQALVTLRAGGTALMLGDIGFPALQLEAMVRFGATGLSSVPPSLRWVCQAALEAEPHERPRLGYLASAGAALDETTRCVIVAGSAKTRPILLRSSCTVPMGV